MVIQQIGQRIDEHQVPGVVLAHLVAIVELQAIFDGLIVLDGLQSARPVMLLKERATSGFPPFRLVVVKGG